MKKIISHTVHASKKQPIHAAFLSLLLVCNVMILAIVSHATTSFAAGSPPFNTAIPALSGTAAVGQTLTTDDGIWTNLPTYTYQWRSCDSSGNNCADINGATNNTYTLQASDSGNTVRAVVTATNADGTDSATSPQSMAVIAQLGDINGDGVINVFDLGILLGNWHSGSSPTEDFNNDATVDQLDLNLLLAQYQP